MRTSGWNGLALVTAAIVVAGSAGGCKTLSERYIALEVWKYERCFGHLPPGFVPHGAQPPMAAAPPQRVCGQAGPAPCCPPMASNDCCGQGGGGMPMGPPGGFSGGPTPAGVTAGRPVIISDELVVP